MQPPFALTPETKGIFADDGYDALRRKLENRLVNVVMPLLASQMQRVIDKYTQGYPVDKGFWQLELMRMRQGLMPEITNAIQDAERVAMADIAAGIGVGVDLAQIAPKLSKWARKYSFDLIKGLTDNTRKAVQEAVATWAEAHGTTPELAKSLEPLFGERRAKTIGSTEITRMFSTTQHEVMDATGVFRKREWRTAEDEKVCPICGALDGKQVSMDRPFADDIDDPPAHPNCRCWIVPVVPEL